MEAKGLLSVLTHMATSFDSKTQHREIKLTAPAITGQTMLELMPVIVLHHVS